MKAVLLILLYLLVALAAPAAKQQKTAVASKAVKAVASSRPRQIARAKRAVIYEVENAPTDELKNTLSDLTDDQLELLGELVQGELEQYEADQPSYAVVEVPEEYVYASENELFPRDRRSIPIEVYEDDNANEFEELPELMVIPEEEVERALIEEMEEEEKEEEEAIAAKELDDLQLRLRIAEMADILNERASRYARRR